MSATSWSGSGEERTSANVVRNPPASVSGSCIVRSSGTNRIGRRIATGSPTRTFPARSRVLVEDDADLRHLMAALFEDEQMDTIECESAEAALATMLIGGREVAMIFADVRLRGVMDGIDLAREVKMRWPFLPVILTSGHPREHVGKLPPGVAYMPKPWQPLNVLIAAEQALASRGDVPR